MPGAFVHAPERTTVGDVTAPHIPAGAALRSAEVARPVLGLCMSLGVLHRHRWLSCLVVTLAILALFAAPGLARRAKASHIGTQLEQCENGTSGSGACTGSAWIRGDLNRNKSLYRQGDFVPFRTEIDSLAAGHTYTLRVGYDAVEEGKHAYDYLGSVDGSASPGQQIVPCSGIADTAGPHACGHDPSQLLVPIDTHTSFPGDAGQAAGNFSAWGGTLEGAAYVASSRIGVGTPGTVQREIDVTFTAAGPTVVLAWGGHIASVLDWGAGNTFVSTDNGAPFHMRLKQVQESGQPAQETGNQELSLHADALAAVPGLATAVAATSITTDQAVVDTATLTAAGGHPVTGEVQFFVCGPESIAPPDCSHGGVRVGGPQVVALVPPPNGPNGQATIEFPQAGVGQMAPGRYCFRAEYTPDAVAAYSATLHTNVTTECFVATLPPPQLTVTKLCVPESDPGLFNLLLDGSAVPDGTDVPCGGSRGPFQTGVGTHNLSESAGTGTNLADYTSTIGGDCAADGSITIALGNSATCTVTNVRVGDPTGFLRVDKVCVPADDPGQFEVHVDGIKVADLSCGETTVPLELTPGDHTVSEASGVRTSRSGYTTVISGACAADGSVTVVANETKDCTITNTRVPPVTTLTLRKACLPRGDDGRFRLSVFTLKGHRVHRAIVQCGGTTGAVHLAPATYLVRERGADGTELSDYHRILGGDCLSNGTVTLEAGDHARCWFVNVRRRTPQPAALTVTKICDPTDDGGRFNLTVDGQTETDVACGGSFGPISVAAGQHQVSESAGTGTNLSDYTSAIGGDCAADGSVTLPAGKQATCTITNVRTGTSAPEPPDETGTVEIVKLCSPAGTRRQFQLELDEYVFYLACGESTGSMVVPVGGHRVGELALNGVTGRFTTTIGGDCASSGSFTLSAGEHVMCIVTNTRTTPTPPLVPPAACYTMSAQPRTAIAGRRVRIVARVRLGRRPIEGVRVHLAGPGISAVGTTGRMGRSVFSATPLRRGLLVVSIRKAFGCPKRPPENIGVVGAATPPVTG
jgi:Prealbumin-like fold domain